MQIITACEKKTALRCRWLGLLAGLLQERVAAPPSPYSLSHCCRWLGLFAGLLISPRKHSRAFSSLSLSRSSSLSRAAAGGWACWPVYCISEKLPRAFSSLRVGAAGGWACWPVFCIKRLQHRCINLKRLLRFSALLLPCCSSRKGCAAEVYN